MQPHIQIYTQCILVCSVNSGYFGITKDQCITNIEIILINLIQYNNHLKTNLIIISQDVLIILSMGW